MRNIASVFYSTIQQEMAQLIAQCGGNEANLPYHKTIVYNYFKKLNNMKIEDIIHKLCDKYNINYYGLNFSFSSEIHKYLPRIPLIPLSHVNILDFKKEEVEGALIFLDLNNNKIILPKYDKIQEMIKDRIGFESSNFIKNKEYLKLYNIKPEDEPIYLENLKREHELFLDIETNLKNYNNSLYDKSVVYSQLFRFELVHPDLQLSSADVDLLQKKESKNLIYKKFMALNTSDFIYMLKYNSRFIYHDFIVTQHNIDDIINELCDKKRLLAKAHYGNYYLYNHNGPAIIITPAGQLKYDKVLQFPDRGQCILVDILNTSNLSVISLIMDLKFIKYHKEYINESRLKKQNFVNLGDNTIIIYDNSFSKTQYDFYRSSYTDSAIYYNDIFINYKKEILSQPEIIKEITKNNVIQLSEDISL